MREVLKPGKSTPLGNNRIKISRENRGKMEVEEDWSHPEKIAKTKDFDILRETKWRRGNHRKVVGHSQYHLDRSPCYLLSQRHIWLRSSRKKMLRVEKVEPKEIDCVFRY